MIEDIKNKVIGYLENQSILGSTLYTEELNKSNDIKEENQEQNQYIIETSENPEIIDMDNKTKEYIDDLKWKDANGTFELYEATKNCQKCRLGQTRKNYVFGSGNPDAEIMIIGEAPGADEDEQGLPFVGRAGQLLTKIIESIELKREDVYICNIVKCRPPKNRAPVGDEVESCLPYLLRQIEIIKPIFILALGATAVESLTKTKVRMADTRGTLLEFHGIKMLVTYHPAALLYNPNLKRDVWEDMKFLKRLLEDYKKDNKL